MLEELSEATAGAAEKGDKVAIERSQVAMFSPTPDNRKVDVGTVFKSYWIFLRIDSLPKWLPMEMRIRRSIRKAIGVTDPSSSFPIFGGFTPRLCWSLANAPASPRWIETTAWRILSAAMASRGGTECAAEGFFIDTGEIVPADLLRPRKST